MPDHEPTHEFHDDLLSAYLDDELSPAERARVEERLAVDPVARQMLDELQSVSQAVQGLPHEKVGEDLRAPILQRATQATITTPTATSTPATLLTASTASEGGPQFTIGKTRRGWVWAALAVAAALLIMFVQRDTLHNEKLPEVASSDGGDKREIPSIGAVAHDSSSSRSRDESLDVAAGNQPAGDLGIRPQSESFFDVQNKAAAPVSTVPAPPTTIAFDGLAEGSGKQSTEGIAANSTGRLFGGEDVDQRGATLNFGFTQDNLPQSNRSTQMGTVLDSASGLGGGRSGGVDLAATTPTQPGSVSAGVALHDDATVTEGATAATTEALDKVIPDRLTERDGILIVYVDMKPESLRDGDFDRKLETNGIALDAAPEDGTKRLARSLEDSFTTNTLDYYHYLQSEWNKREPSEVVLVDAPAAQIAGLIGALDADSGNVVSISVDDKQLANQDAKSALVANVNWFRYRRVGMPEEMRQLSERGGNRISDMSDSSKLASSESGPARRAGRGGGGAGGGRGRAGGGRGGRRGAAPAAGATAEPRGMTPGQAGGGAPTEPVAGDDVALRGQAGGKDVAAQDSFGRGTGTALTESQIQQVPQPRGGGGGGGEREWNFGDRGNFGSVPASGVDPQRSLGRARRMLLTPQTSQSSSDSRFDVSREVSELGDDRKKEDIANAAQTARQTAQPASARPAEKPNAAFQMQGAPASAGQVAGGQVAGGQSAAGQPTNATTAAAPPVSGPPASAGAGFGALYGRDAATTAIAAEESESNRGLQQGRGERAPAKQSEARNTLQVLFVLRAAPAPTATPATDASGKATTSPTAADPAK